MFKKNKKSTLPHGWYNDSVKLADTNDSKKIEEYKVIVYVEELDKYTNGIVKIKLINIEIMSGFQSSQYDHVINILTKRFISIKDSSEINWLVSENSIKEERKEKLDKINKSNFFNRIFK